MWSKPQRGVVWAIVAGMFVYLCIRSYLNRTIVSDPQPDEGVLASELADHLDPNVATREELAAIPNVGEKLAGAVVAYREEYLKLHGGGRAFGEPRDLLAVTGVGIGKLEAMEPYLVFPGRGPTRPATTRGR